MASGNKTNRKGESGRGRGGRVERTGFYHLQVAFMAKYLYNGYKSSELGSPHVGWGNREILLLIKKNIYTYIFLKLNSYRKK